MTYPPGDFPVLYILASRVPHTALTAEARLALERIVQLEKEIERLKAEEPHESHD